MTETRAETPIPLPIRVVLAPLIALERSRGWRRRLLATLYLAIVAACAVLAWRSLSLWNLPDLGPPFDVKAASYIEIKDDENAFVLYRRAVKALVPPPIPAKPTFFANFDWSKAGPEARDWVARNRGALETYRLGAERPRALHHQPGELSFETRLDVSQDLRSIARLALLEASRRRLEGDMAGAWSLYRANLRASRHLRSHSTMIEALIGLADLTITATPATEWAADPRADAALIRRALADVKAVAAMTPPTSELLKSEYLVFTKAIRRARSLHEEMLKDSMDWYHHWRPWRESFLFLRREPERSRRVVDLVFANWLAHCDEPLADRPKFSKKDPRVYLDSGRSMAGMSPDELAAWVDSSEFPRYFMPAFSHLITAMDRDPRILGSLEVSLAEQLYRRDHDGKEPPNASVLVPNYLDRLPAGYVDPRAPTP